ncbi:hypothetical protein D9M68_897400 [compost metagenome]
MRAGGRGHDTDAAGTLQHHIAQLAFAADDICQGALGRQTEQHVDVGQPQVGVHQHDAPSQLGQRQRQIHRHIGLADATFAAGHRDHLYGMHATHVCSLPCLT